MYISSLSISYLIKISRQNNSIQDNEKDCDSDHLGRFETDSFYTGPTIMGPLSGWSVF